MMTDEEYNQKLEDLEDALGILGTIANDESSSEQREGLWALLKGETRQTLSVTTAFLESSEQTFAIFSEKPLSNQDIKDWVDLMETEYGEE